MFESKTILRNAIASLNARIIYMMARKLRLERENIERHQAEGKPAIDAYNEELNARAEAAFADKSFQDTGLEGAMPLEQQLSLFMALRDALYQSAMDKALSTYDLPNSFDQTLAFLVGDSPAGVLPLEQEVAKRIKQEEVRIKQLCEAFDCDYADFAAARRNVLAREIGALREGREAILAELKGYEVPNAYVDRSALEVFADLPLQTRGALIDKFGSIAKKTKTTLAQRAMSAANMADALSELGDVKQDEKVINQLLRAHHEQDI